MNHCLFKAKDTKGAVGNTVDYSSLTNKAEGFEYFLYWILVGCPYGIRKMCMFLVPKNFGIAGSMGILALNCIVGGLIGGIIVLVRIIVIFTEIIKVIAGHFWTQCPKV